METFSALLSLCAENSPVTRSFDIFFDLCLIKRLSKQSRRWWFETQSHWSWRHCNGNETTLFFHLVNSMISDDPIPRGARASTGMVLTRYSSSRSKNPTTAEYCVISTATTAVGVNWLQLLHGANEKQGEYIFKALLIMWYLSLPRYHWFKYWLEEQTPYIKTKHHQVHQHTWISFFISQLFVPVDLIYKVICLVLSNHWNFGTHVLN